MDQQQIFQQIAEFWTNKMPFNQLLGLKITQFDCKQSEVHFF